MWIDQRGSEVLVPSECRRLVARAAKHGGVGRLGVSRDGAPIIEPVNFTYDAEHGHRVLVRLGDGSFSEAVSGALVSLEVDEVDREHDVAWSVLIRGLATPLAPEEIETLGRDAPRPLVPSPGTTVFALRDDIVTGRRFALRGAGGTKRGRS